jgi:hypothetical protein
LANALLEGITHRWQTEVATKDFMHWRKVIAKDLKAALDEVVADAPSGVKLAAMKYRDNGIHAMKITLHSVLRNAATAAQSSQKKLSRLIERHVASHFIDAYDQANLCKGKGSVKKRKVCGLFSNHQARSPCQYH